MQINGRVGKMVSMGRGLRQGCPMSQILFACLQDPLYRLINVGVCKGGGKT